MKTLFRNWKGKITGTHVTKEQLEELIGLATQLRTLVNPQWLVTYNSVYEDVQQIRLMSDVIDYAYDLASKELAVNALAWSLVHLLIKETLYRTNELSKLEKSLNNPIEYSDKSPTWAVKTFVRDPRAELFGVLLDRLGIAPSEVAVEAKKVLECAIKNCENDSHSEGN